MSADTLAGVPSVTEASNVLCELLVARGWAAREERFVPLSFTQLFREGFAGSLELSVREISDVQPADSLKAAARGIAKELAAGLVKGAARKVTRGSWPVRPPVRVSAYAGLECLPATRVLRALSGNPEGRVRVGGGARRNEQTRETFGWVELKPTDEWRARLEVLVKVMDQRARALAKAYGTPAAFVEELRTGGDQNVEGLLAALIAFDHAGDARELIAEYDENAVLARQRCFRQALRILDAEVSLETLEEVVGEPPPTRVEVDWGRLRHIRSEARDAKRQRAEILSVVRDSHAKTREERRLVMKSELASRGIHWAPLKRENELDELEPDYVKLEIGTIGAVREVIRIGRAAADAATRDTPAPPWLARPQAACYKLGRRGAEAGVDLDPTIEPFLDDVFSTVAFRVESEKLNASMIQTELWFARSSEDPAVIVASIGEQRVGVVEAEAHAALIEAIAPAETRSEQGWAEAWLHRRHRDPRYVLLFRVPGWQPDTEETYETPS